MQCLKKLPGYSPGSSRSTLESGSGYSASTHDHEGDYSGSDDNSLSRRHQSQGRNWLIKRMNTPLSHDTNHRRSYKASKSNFHRPGSSSSGRSSEIQKTNNVRIYELLGVTIASMYVRICVAS